MSTAFAEHVHTLTGGQPPRVWSLLVTVFGDLAQDQGDAISGALLRRLTEQIGIKPEANRVALHRLRKDNWIVSHRTGRKSEYALTGWGRAQTQLASPRIYSAEPMAQEVWMIAGDRKNLPPNAEILPIGMNLFLSQNSFVHEHILSSRIEPDTEIPLWISEQVCDEQTVSLTNETRARLDAVWKSLGEPEDLTLLQKAALRVLIVHAWRRVVLRTAILPNFVFPTEWQGERCRSVVATLLTRLDRPRLADLEEVISASNTV